MSSHRGGHRAACRRKGVVTDKSELFGVRQAWVQMLFLTLLLAWALGQII